MKWRKLGRLWAPKGDLPWARTHAMVPTPLFLPDGRLRLLVASADEQMVARVGWIDLDSHNPTKVLGQATTPLLDIGLPGMFDDSGVNPCQALVMPDESVRFYYLGYQRHRRIPYTIFAGLATGHLNSNTFTRLQETPIVERGSGGESIIRSALSVHPLPAGGWQMWYIAGGEFVTSADRLQPRYSLWYMTSPDGIHWPTTGREVVRPTESELGFGRPWVIPDKQNNWRIFYSIRSPIGYRMGTATSADGVAWTRRDEEIGISPSVGDWDGEMICYGAVIDIHGKRYMFYNGNGYGRSGVGLAVLEHD